MAGSRRDLGAVLKEFGLYPIKDRLVFQEETVIVHTKHLKEDFYF
jgi:hypothetical protein